MELIAAYIQATTTFSQKLKFGQTKLMVVSQQVKTKRIQINHFQLVRS